MLQSKRQKGKSLLILPSNYTVIDIETTGLDPGWCEIIELSALRVRDDEVVDSFSTLVKPVNDIDDFIQKLTGITNNMVADAPNICASLPNFLDFIGNDIVVGHNVNFDINFIYDQKIKIDGMPFQGDYVDTMRIAKKVLPDLPHHRLLDLAKYFSLPYESQHRGESDCRMAYMCYSKLKEIAVQSGVDLKSKPKIQAKSKDVVASFYDFDESHPLFGRVCVFTGKLDRMTRKEAMQAVADIGGINGDNVTKKTNFLILGNNDFCTTLHGEKSSKQKKAEKLILEGQDIQIMSENVFYDMISE